MLLDLIDQGPLVPGGDAGFFRQPTHVHRQLHPSLSHKQVLGFSRLPLPVAPDGSMHPVLQPRGVLAQRQPRAQQTPHISQPRGGDPHFRRRPADPSCAVPPCAFWLPADSLSARPIRPAPAGPRTNTNHRWLPPPRACLAPTSSSSCPIPSCRWPHSPEHSPVPARPSLRTPS